MAWRALWVNKSITEARKHQKSFFKKVKVLLKEGKQKRAQTLARQMEVDDNASKEGTLGANC